MIKLGLVSAILPDFTFEELIDYASSIGLEAVEVCCWPKGGATRRYGGVTHIDLDKSDDDKLKYYLDYAKRKNITISTLSYYPNPLDSDEQAAKVAIEHIYKLIDASSKMGVNLVNTFIGRDKALNDDDNLAKFEKVWNPILRHAESKGVRIAIENCPMYFSKDEWPTGVNLMSSPHLYREIFKRASSEMLGLNFDPSHLILIHSDVEQAVREFADRIFHVHLKDLRIDKRLLAEYGILSYPGMWHFPKLPGLGDVDMKGFVSALNEVGFNGYACVEIEDRAFEGSVEDVKKGIEQSCRFMRTIV